MSKGLTRLVSILILMWITGCASLDPGLRKRETFPGARSDVTQVRVATDWDEAVCAALDLPWSALVDTILYPIDLANKRQVHPPKVAGSWLDENNRIKYCFVTYTATNWPTSILISDWSGPGDTRNGVIKKGTIFFHGERIPPNADGQAWLRLPHSLRRVQLYPGDVVSNEISIAAAPTPQLIQRIVRMRSGLELKNESK